MRVLSKGDGLRPCRSEDKAEDEGLAEGREGEGYAGKDQKLVWL